MTEQSANDWQDEYRSMLGDLLDLYSPASVLAIGGSAQQDLDPWLRTHPDVRIHVEPIISQAAANLPSLGMQDFALVSGGANRASTETMGVLTARLRDLYARRTFMLLSVPGSASGVQWSHTDMVGAGFTRLRRWPVGDREEMGFYGFDIDSYKTTPDWLNSRHWAHPELFDKYRW